jgi:hypothetical protein
MIYGQHPCWLGLRKWKCKFETDFLESMTNKGDQIKESEIDGVCSMH